jgi:DNA-binding transcriptional regulator LsrR (DeoR family)
MSNSKGSIPPVGSFPRRRRTPRRSQPVTPEIAAEMWEMYFVQGMSQHEIAAHFHVNQGRVSTAVNPRR